MTKSSFKLYYVRQFRLTLIRASLLGVGCALGVTGCHRSTPELFEAVESNDLSKVDLLLADHAAIDSRDHAGNTALHLASTGEMAKLLIGYGADVDAVNDADNTPLHIAAYSGNADVASVLLSNGASVDAVNKWGDTPLHMAAVFMPPEGLGPNGIDEDLFLWHDPEGKRVAAAKLLLSHGAKVNVHGWRSNTPLSYAVGRPSLNLARLLLANGADPDFHDYDGRSLIDIFELSPDVSARDVAQLEQLLSNARERKTGGFESTDD